MTDHFYKLYICVTFITKILGCKIDLHSLLSSVCHQLLLLELLLRHFLLLWLGSSSGLGESTFLLDQAEFDVAGGGHVGIDPTVGTVSPTPHLGSTVHLDVVNNQVVGIQPLVLSVRLCVLQEVKQELGRLDGPPTLRCTVNLSL